MTKHLFLVVIGMVLGACSLLKAPAPQPVQTYVLQAPVASVAAPANGDIVLVVAEPRAQAGYDTTRIAYVKRDFALDYYANSRWADTPARMLQPLLVARLEAGRHYKAILRAPAAASGGLRLETEIVRFEQSFTNSPSREIISVRAQLLDTRQGKVLGTRVFTAEAEAPSEDAYGGVRAANQALAQLLGEIGDYCAALSGR